MKLVFLSLLVLTLSACKITPTGKITPGPSTEYSSNQTSTDNPIPNDTSLPPLPDDIIDTMVPSPQPTPSNLPADLPTEAIIKTQKGDISLRLYPDKAPKTVANFAQKANSGFYQNLIFHRVEDWVIQGGDPLGNGTGGGQIETELSNTPFKLGSLGVARGGNINISNDSQFFICTKDCSWLTGQYTNFGEVISGMEVALKIQPGDKILSVSVR